MEEQAMKDLTNKDLTNKDLTIEEGLNRLEKVLGEMENPETELEGSFNLYQEGIGLLKRINDQIDTVEKKVMVLSEGGTLSEFNEE